MTDRDAGPAGSFEDEQSHGYRAGDDELGFGSSLGNGHTWVNIGSDGRVQTLFGVEVGEEVAGPMMIRYSSPGAHVHQERSAKRGGEDNVPLFQSGSGRLFIHPTHYKHVFNLPVGVEVEETIFVPRVQQDMAGDDCVVYVIVKVRNQSAQPQKLGISALARLGGSRRHPVIKGEYDTDRRAIFAAEENHPDWVRILSSTRQPINHVLTRDYGALYDTDRWNPGEEQCGAEGDVMGCLEVESDMEPGGEDSVAFCLSFTDQGRAAAEQQLERLGDAESIFQKTQEYYSRELSTCCVFTPDATINEGVYWAKVNMLRVLGHYPQGETFTNEPGVSSNIVARDVVWFVYGCDHFRPESSRRMLDKLAELQFSSGMIPEYYNALTGECEDYGLNINDATPLFVLGVNHHARSTGDLEWLEEMYESVAAASRYILSQRDERGLVYCDAEGEEVWGICSWRNVIPNYQINGAVTEINAECAAALRAVGHMADNIGREEEGQWFYDRAMELADDINEHLLDEDRQLYLLNIDTDGKEHTDVTADELFPVLFRVAPRDVAYRIVRRLNSSDFWTEAGLRTVSRLDPLYHPSRHVGLLGGVWPGVTWWYAFAAARYHPEFMVDALHASFAHYERDPRLFTTVPGQFSEWFDGESLINRGMRLSPWEPPRFLWAAVEGVGGLMLSPEEPGINPLIPPDWKWVGAEDIPYHGESLTWFAGRMDGEINLYANAQFQCDSPHEVFGEDVSRQVKTGHEGVHCVALREEGWLVVALGSSCEESVSTPVDLSGLVGGQGKWDIRQYSSERDQWGESRVVAAGELATVGVRLEKHGYHLLELRSS